MFALMSGHLEELNTARESIREAIVFAEKVSAAVRADSHMIKSDFSPVTLADYGVQAIIHRRLYLDYRHDPIVAEEDTHDLELPENSALLDRLIELLNESCGPWTKDDVLTHIGRGRHTGGSTGRFWTLDPIDGTKGFIRGDQYAIALALIDNGIPVLGVLGCPRLELPSQPESETRYGGWICHGNRGEAFAESTDGKYKRKLAASCITSTRDMVVCESVESGHSAHDISSVITKELGVHRKPVRMDSQAKYAAVAGGIADAYFRFPTKADYREKIWDHAAGACIVESAGGKVTDISGAPLDFSRGRALNNNRGVIATAAGVHDAVLEVVKRHLLK